MEGYQPKKKVGMLHPKYKKIKLPKGGFGLEKPNNSNGVRVATAENRRSLRDKLPPKPNNEITMNIPIQCHSCRNKDICKYHGDYLEQIIHIIDVYDGVFDLNCNHYNTIKSLSTRYDDELINKKMEFEIYDQHRRVMQNRLK